MVFIINILKIVQIFVYSRFISTRQRELSHENKHKNKSDILLNSYIFKEQKVFFMKD